MTDDPNAAGMQPESSAPEPSPPVESSGESAPPSERSQDTSDASSSAAPSSADVARAFADGDAAAEAPTVDDTKSDGPKGDGPKGDGAKADGKRRKRRRGKKTGGPGGNEPQQARGGEPVRERKQRTTEEQIDRDAESLAKDARSVAHQRIRPLAVVSREVRRMLASPNHADRREARRALVMMKSKLAFLAGREVGRDRAAMVKVRDAVFKGIDGVVKYRDEIDPKAARNLLDHLDAFVGYHRFHCDERRRD